MARFFAALTLLGSSACVPTYSHLPPIQPAELYAPVPYQWAAVDDVNIAFQDTGGDAPVILWVHGLSSYASFWEYQMTAFPEHRSIAIDLPGYGASDRPDAPYTMQWFAEVVVSFMDVQGLDHVILAGHSMGGQIALTAALEYPERFDALVLSAPAGFESFSRGHREWMSDYWTETRAMNATESHIRANFSQFTFAVTDEGVERLIEERVRMRNTDAFSGTSVAVARSINGMVHGPVRDRLEQIQTPTLVVFGTHDALIPNPVFNGGRTRSVAEYGANALPNAKLVMVKRAGHTVHHDDADTFNAAVTRFLAEQSPE
jgi:pimeloyl-ACP methyl ester carboxylesterase